MAEWSKAHAWKVCNRQKRFMGSNPILSANETKSRGEARDFAKRQDSSSLEVLPFLQKTAGAKRRAGFIFFCRDLPQGSRQ
jgi:hypothetical protein